MSLQKIKELVYTNNGEFIRHDGSSKDLFMEVYTTLKSVKPAERKALVKDVREHIKATVPEVSTARTVVAIVNYADTYVSMNAISHLSNMRWYNIKAFVQVLRFISKNYGKDDVKRAKTLISKKYEKGMSPHRYNNDVADGLAELKELYPHREVDGELVSFDVRAVFNKMSDEQKAQMLALLTAESNITEPSNVSEAV